MQAGMHVPTTVSRVCKLCGGALRPRFSLRLRDELRGEYLECRACQMLQSFHLDDRSSEQLARLYALEPGEDLDPGAAWRQWSIASRVLQLARLGAFGPRRALRHLDFGGGSGFLGAVMAMRLGWDARTYEPYGAATFAPARVLADWSEVERQGPYDLITATEVFEHLVTPRDTLAQLRRVMTGEFAALYLTTGRYRPGVHDGSWPYLAPQSGQHVCFWSDEAIRHAARLLDMDGVFQVGAEYEWLLVRAPRRFRLRARAASAVLTQGVRRGWVSKIE